MIVIYRITDLPSTHQPPVHELDKVALNELCLKSFVKAFEKIQPKVIFLYDFRTADRESMIDQIVPFEYEYYPTSFGINGTMLRAYEMAREQDDDILFQECDYLYRPHTGSDLVNGVNALGLVSPYDHPNFYIDRNLHSTSTNIYLVDDVHWRSTERNTMTFAVKNKIFKDNYAIFKKYGYLDADVWYDLKSAGQELYVPIPSLATHMVKDYLAPGIKWEDEWRKNI